MTLKMFTKLFFPLKKKKKKLFSYFYWVLKESGADILDFFTISIVLVDKLVSLFASSWLIISSLNGYLSKLFYKSNVWEHGGQHISVQQSECSFHSVSQASRLIPLNYAGTSCQSSLQQNQLAAITSKVVWESPSLPEGGKQAIICKSLSNPEQFPTCHCESSALVSHATITSLSPTYAILWCVCVCVFLFLFFFLNTLIHFSSSTLLSPSSGGM